MFVSLRPLTRALVTLTALNLWAGCGPALPEEAAVRTEAQLELQGTPSARYDANTGKTTVVLQFIAREKVAGAPDGQAQPLGPQEVSVSLRVDGREVDNESMLQAGAEELASSLVYGMVLDASYSMLQHDPPAFEPMKRAAKRSIDKGLELWANQKGSFQPLVSWFDEYLYTQDGAWAPEDVLSIPAPKEGTATKLYAAVHAMTARLSELRQSGVGAGARDRHMMLVFSDGADNLSWFDNSHVAEALSTTSGARYLRRGAQSTTLEQTLELIRSHPGLTVHVIGLGSKVNEEELRAIAKAGRGLYFSNPLSGEIDDVFERVTKEFATLQTVGATMPIPPGAHTFELVVTPRGGGKAAACKLAFTAGEGAAIDAVCASDSAAPSQAP